MPDPADAGFDPGRIVRTLRYLPPGVVVRRLTRPLRGGTRRVRRALFGGPGSVSETTLALPEPPSVPGRTWFPPARFDFLNIERDFGVAPVWTAAPSRLWGYHLHYLDALREGESSEARLRLLDAWLAANPFASAPGWESYPLSLRLVNAFEFLVAAGGTALSDRKDAMALQAWWLEGNTERDLGANHLWKNALALVWAGRCLEGRAPTRWRRTGEALALQEIRDQLLPDGFHVERSPGYHAVLVDDLIRLERLLRAAGDAGSEFGRRVSDARRRTATALASVVHPDGEVPLFNDTAFGQAPPAPWILTRAAELDSGTRSSGDPRGATAAGFHVLRGERSLMIFDAGEIGFAGQPGHAHADTLSYELSFDATRVVVDAGVFDYERSERRAYARGTRAHNTVELDGRDQSEMWGAFRVGRRAHPKDVRRDDREGRAAITAAHDGYAHLAGGPVHRRTVLHLGADSWRIEDAIEGTGEHQASSRIRLHPSFRPSVRDGSSLAASDGRTVVRIVGEAAAPLTTEEGRYFPRFGVEERCLVARFDARGRGPLRLAYRLELSTRS